MRIRRFSGGNCVKRRWLAALIVLATLAGCVTSPTGRTQFLLISPEAAIAQSRTAYVQTVGQLRRDGKLLDDPLLGDRLAIITGRLVAVTVARYPHTATWNWSVAMIDEPDTVNAWCMAGGRMAVYNGLVDKLDLTDDELAQIMGHEISHAVANHTAERMSMAIAQGIGVLAVGAATDDEGARRGAQLAAVLAIELPNSRVGEREADRMGIEIAARAGYDPAAAVTLWRKMEREGGTGPPQFLSTHPNPANRRETLAALGQQMQALRPAAPPEPRPVEILP
ncbi:MAG: M48 family metallopeptidase [Gammaproteobacteria bacterium]|nr:M48 family metallopeptidase [Gammaproteobacteria bacterium]